MRAGFHQVAIVLMVLVAGAAQGDESTAGRRQPVEIRAERIVYDVRGEHFDAVGSAEVRRGASTIRADSIRFDEPSGRGVAEGNVVIEDGPDTLHAQRIELDVHSFEGVIFDGHLSSEATAFRAHGARIEKTGANTYRFEDGHFTPCACPDDERPPWAIAASESKFEVEGYGTARNARFEVLGVPVVWLPWMIYPVKTKRQSGILLPQFALSGRSGVEIGLPVFLALGDLPFHPPRARCGRLGRQNDVLARIRCATLG